MPTTDEIKTWHGRHVIGTDGHKIGTIDELYLDDVTGQPAWALVHTGLLGRKSSFLPITDAHRVNDDVHVPFDEATVKDAPGIDPDGHLSPQEETELFRYYGHTATQPDASGAPPMPAPDAAASRSAARGAESKSDGAMTLSEEQVRVGTRELPATKVRMRKVTITEDVTVTVPVTHEEVRLEEVPIDAPDVDDALPANAEVTLRREVPVVEKATVESERVRLGKDRVTDHVEVTEPVRREEIDLDHAPADGRSRKPR